MRFSIRSAVLPRIVAIRASFKSLLIESEAQQFSALLIQGGNGANFPDVEIERKQPMAKCCGERSRAARSQPPRSDQTQSPLNGFAAASCQIGPSSQCPCSPV